MKYTRPLANVAPSRRLNRAAPWARPWSPTATIAWLFVIPVMSGSGFGMSTQVTSYCGTRLLVPVELGVGLTDDGEHLQCAAIGDEAVALRVVR